jgi:biotin carboxyl carrier protein
VFETSASTNSAIISGTKSFTAEVVKADLGMDKLAAVGVQEVKAPMPGMVLNIIVSTGDEVKKGDALLVLEAMKMENIIKSPRDGKVKTVKAIKGTAVEKNQSLIVFE